MRGAGLVFVVTVGACARDAPPPLPEALVVVDTDLPVPRVVSRLRIDLYSADGTWFDTRDDLLPDPRDWPASFGVYSDDESRERVVVVRLRAYPDARLVRYTGAIYAAPRALREAIPRGDGQPRLVFSGVDRTPELEPDPTVAIDRVLRVRLVPGARGRVRVTLRGACAGALAKVSPIAEAASCVDGDDALVPAAELPLEASIATSDLPTETGAFARDACALAPPDGAVCVEGGAFLFGDAFYRPTGAGTPVLSSRPERVVAVSPFFVDTDEVSVARYRDALARGFAPPTAVGVTEKDGGAFPDPTKACTFSAAPRGREAYPLSCVPWETASAFCRFVGGNLPTEAQWEYAAVAAARASKSSYPWGDDPPTCDRAIYGRTAIADDCLASGAGPQPLGSAADVSAAGVRDLAASLEEHARDASAAFGAPCWLDAPARDPMCVLPVPPACAADPTSLDCAGEPSLLHALRGGSWFSSADDLRIVARTDAARVGKGGDDPLLGFRCVYPAR